MTRLPILAALVAVAALPAQALSCLRPDAVRLFQFAEQSADPFVIVKGNIVADGPIALPEAGRKEAARTTMRVEGMGLGKAGFDVPVDLEVRLDLTCVSVWCASPPGEGELIMALKVEGDARILEVNPCGGAALPWTEDGETRLLECYRTGNCRVPDF